MTFDENYFPDLLKILKNLKKRYELFNKINKKIKKDLKNFNILHKDKKGINVIVKFDNDKEREKIINYCDKNNLFNTLYIINKEYPDSKFIKTILPGDYNPNNDNCFMVLSDKN